MTDKPTVIPLSRFQADLSRALARRGQRLLEAHDLAERVPTLEPLEAYFIVKELGIEDASPIVRHCTPEQLQTFVDLDCWSNDHPDDVEIDAWLAPFAAEGPESLAQAFGGLEEELQLWFLGTSLEIFDAHTEEPPPDPPEGIQRRLTPDTYYYVERKEGLLREIEPVLLVEALYAADLENAYRLLTAARNELSASIEEELFRFRQSRVEAMGFPSRPEALQIYGPPPRAPRPTRRPKNHGETSLPAVYAGPLNEGSLLGRALGRIADPDVIAHLELELRVLINHAVVAHGGSPGSVQNAMRTAGFVRDTLSLGLEALVSPDEPVADPEDIATADKAAAALSTWTLFEVHRFGHHEVTAVQEQARELARDPAILSWRNRSQSRGDGAGETRDRADREFFDGLLTNPPLHAGWDALHPAARRAFGSKRETEDAATRLEEIYRRVKAS